LVNAVQAIEHKYGEIRITTSHNKDQGTVVLSVQDNGKGISTAISDKIFDPFFTEWQSIGGTGLGLPITQNLVKANDGEITFKSRMGKGTAFLVSFTIERKKKPFKILLVDDEEAILETMKEALTIERHYIIEQARDGNEALIKIGIYHPDLLILDVFMPKMDGVEVCRAIKRQPEFKNMKIIILTGYPGHEKVKEVAEMGFTKVVSKPFQLQEFIKEVDGMLSAEIGERVA
jgi:CheY-like chemotaxis protein